MGIKKECPTRALTDKPEAFGQFATKEEGLASGYPRPGREILAGNAKVNTERPACHESKVYAITQTLV
jgi:hypothetical protein